MGDPLTTHCKFLDDNEPSKRSDLQRNGLAAIPRRVSDRGLEMTSEGRNPLFPHGFLPGALASSYSPDTLGRMSHGVGPHPTSLFLGGCKAA